MRFSSINLFFALLSCGLLPVQHTDSYTVDFPAGHGILHDLVNIKFIENTPKIVFFE